MLGIVRTAAAGSLIADDDDNDEPTNWRDDRAFFEWSTWVRLGFGVASTPTDNIARSTLPPELHDQATTWDAALGADLTLLLPTRKVRMGPWIELSTKGVFAGAELSIAGSVA